MIIKKAEFIISAVSPAQYPPDDRPEIAFAGRSNVGKSSLLNAILGRKSLAKTSSQPGKTRTINFFNINDYAYFVDLPGYGYARVSKAEKLKWGKIIEEYLNGRSSLIDVVLLVDIRHEPTLDDRLMYEWIKSHNRKVTVVATKSDKISRGQYQKHISVIKKSLQMENGDNLVIFSSLSKSGREEIWHLFDSLLGVDELKEQNPVTE
jgi:GTP-binding protein